MAAGRRASLPLILLAAGCATPAPPSPAPMAEAGVAFDRAGERGGFAEGLADPREGRTVTLDDPVRVASVSKLVVALGVMKLVEQGRLDLDADVSAYLDWTLRNPAFPDRPISLRQMLSHTSSIRDQDDQYAVPLGETVAEAVARPGSWDRVHPPGEAYFAYANMNFPIVASAMERVTGERFDLWMRREILDPLKVDACFNWPSCSDVAVGRAVALWQDGKPVRDDLSGRRPDCPVFVREGQPCDLSHWRPGENGSLFSPQGGRLRSGRWIDPLRGVGVAYFATGLPAAPPRGPSGFTIAEEQGFRRSEALLGR